MRSLLKWLIALLAVTNFGFMTFDGIRALTLGDYIRPETGEYAGRLGPWSEVVQAIGIEPESIVMKITFCCWGMLGLTALTVFISGKKVGAKALLVMSFASLWYLVPGTVLSILQIILILLFWRVKNKRK